MLYTEADAAEARKRVQLKKRILWMPVGALLIAYAAFTALGVRWATLETLLAAFAWAVFYGDLYLLPETRYRGYLKQMAEGLRRTTEAVIVAVEAEEQEQDGAQVLPVRVELTDGSGERFFWIDARKADRMPPNGARVRVESCGRHITALERLN